MEGCSLDHHKEDTFAQHERKTKLVLYINLVVMVIEIVVGYWSGSMALLADGWHMASHSLALGLSVFVYWLYRQKSFKEKFTFGGGKVLSLGGYTSALILFFISLSMLFESTYRLLNLSKISYDLALGVSVFGFFVNLAGALILRDKKEEHVHDHDHHHHHDHKHEHHHDHNHESAYMHILADALTSLLAIGALVFGKFGGGDWMDPVVGILGGVFVLRWSLKLIKSSAGDLLDAHEESINKELLKVELENDGSVVHDIHVWRLGPSHVGCEIFIKRSKNQDLSFYQQKILKVASIQHLVIQIDNL